MCAYVELCICTYVCMIRTRTAHKYLVRESCQHPHKLYQNLISSINQPTPSQKFMDLPLCNCSYNIWVWSFSSYESTRVILHGVIFLSMWVALLHHWLFTLHLLTCNSFANIVTCEYSRKYPHFRRTVLYYTLQTIAPSVVSIVLTTVYSYSVGTSISPHSVTVQLQVYF